MPQVTIIRTGNGPAPLFNLYAGQTSPQPTFIALDCREGRLFGDFNAEIGDACSNDVREGRMLVWGVHPAIRDNALQYLLDRIAPLAQQVLDGYTEDFDGANWWGSLDASAHEASEEIERHCKGVSEDPENIMGVFSCEEWGECLSFSEAWPSDYSLAKASDAFIKGAQWEGVLLTGDVVEYLLDRAEKALQNGELLSTEQGREFIEARPESAYLLDEDD